MVARLEEIAPAGRPLEFFVADVEVEERVLTSITGNSRPRKATVARR
jgi:hypothetical protein